MPKEQHVFRYYLFAFSNLLAAFGGGMILGKGVDIIHTPYLKGGSILAFFVGTVLGLAFIQFIPEKISKPLARWFSICGAIVSLILLSLLLKHSTTNALDGTPALLFFILLSIRFAFWFYSRVLRAASVAGEQQRIAWVELGYYSGMILGLILWELMGINIGLASALIMDACLQFVAGLIDLSGSPHSTNAQPSAAIESIAGKTIQSFSSAWLWRLSSAVIFLTIGVQVVVFDLAHQQSGNASAAILAIFYFGVSVAAFICKKGNIYLNWNNNTHSATIYALEKKNEIKYSALSLTIFSASAVIFSIFGIDQWSLNNFLIYSFIFIAAFFYEILTLALLDRIGFEEKCANQSGMIMRTYGLMGVGAAISLWILGITNSSVLGLLTTVMGCLFFAGLIILKRDFTEQNYLEATGQP